jgi:tetratricopeptide (TPR) repeat protein
VDAEADPGDESDVAAEVEQDAAPKLPEGDPEQLLAEASVYLRYGKRDQAVASLNAVLIQQPAHRGALEKLGEAHTEGGQNDEAIDCWRRAAELAHHDGDAAAHEILRDRIAALDAGAAAALEPMTAAGPDAEGDDLVGADESEFEIELGDDVSEDEGSAASESAEASDADELSFELNVELEMPPEAESEADDAASSSDDTFAGDDDIEIEFDSDHGPAPARSSAEDTVDFADSDMGIEISLGDDEEEDAAASASEAVADATDSSDDLGFEIDASELDIDDEDQEAPAAAASRLEASGSAAFGQSTTTSAKIKEELEEAEFYIQQGLVDEAEAIYRRVLSIAPNHPSALLRLGELAAERGDDPAAASSPQLDVDLGELDEGAGRAGEELAADHSSFDVKEGSEVEIGALGQDGTEDVGDVDDASEDLADLMVAAVESVEGGEGENAAEGPAGDTEVDLTAELGLEDDERGEPEIATSDLTAAGLGDPLGDDSTEVEALAADALTEPELAFGAEPVKAEPDPEESPTDDTMPITDLRRDAGEASGSDEETFDLAEALSDVFGEVTDEGTRAVIPAPSTVEEGFESLFADFKKGVSATLDEGDFDTRYDLGIAYREMGLYDDAIGEFRICLDSPSRQFEGLYMMGICALDLGRHSDAINHLEQALATSELPGERQAGIYFDLGRAHQLAGDVGRARSAYDSVRQLDPGFPGVADQLSALAESGAEAAASLELQAGAEEALESFEDLLGDDEPDAEVAPSDVEPEAFESFDDLITDAERVIEEAEPEPAAKPEPEPKPAPAPKRGGRTGRKKKISFV